MFAFENRRIAITNNSIHARSWSDHLVYQLTCKYDPYCSAICVNTIVAKYFKQAHRVLDFPTLLQAVGITLKKEGTTNLRVRDFRALVQKAGPADPKNCSIIVSPELLATVKHRRQSRRRVSVV